MQVSALPTRLAPEGVDLEALADHLPTPFYAYSATRIRGQIDGLKAALKGCNTTICFAVKANSNIAILQLMAQCGLGADIVSVGELRRSLRAGIRAEQIVFSGVGKTENEVAEALTVGVWKFNLESSDELGMLQDTAQARQLIASAAVRINPDVDARTHEKTSTGKAENKFGVGLAEARHWFADAAQFPNVRLDGLHVHIGSQILDIAPFQQARDRVAAFWRELVAAGHIIRTIDVGGGLGISYQPGQDHQVPIGDYVAAIRRAFTGFDGRIVLEPGRYLVAEAGMLVTRVIRVKAGDKRQFLVVDAAMNDLLRPSLYEAWHDIVPVSRKARPIARYDIVGSVCETGDTFARGRELPACQAGDLLAITGAGAYGASMASTYNSRPLIAEVLLDNRRYAIIRHRQSFEEMVANERLPEYWHTA